MDFEKLSVCKYMQQLINILEINLRNVEKQYKARYIRALDVTYECYGCLIRGAETWDTQEKYDYLKGFLDLFGEFKARWRLMVNAKIVSIRKASEVSLVVVKLTKQVSDWKKSLKRESVSPRLNGESDS